MRFVREYFKAFIVFRARKLTTKENKIFEEKVKRKNKMNLVSIEDLKITQKQLIHLKMARLSENLLLV
jgi:hypothetical protein